jgi:DNA-directed RNA polymerase subunit K
MKNELTKYEKARIIGARALQISQGAPLLIIRPKDVMDPVTMAIMEFEAGKIPINVERPEH